MMSVRQYQSSLDYYQMFTRWLESCPDIVLHSHSLEQHDPPTTWIHVYISIQFSDGQHYEYATAWITDGLRSMRIYNMLVDIEKRTGWSLFEDVLKFK